MAMGVENTSAEPAPEMAVAWNVKPRSRLAAHSWNADGTPVDPDAEIIGQEDDEAPAEVPTAPVVPAEPVAAPVAPDVPATV